MNKSYCTMYCLLLFIQPLLAYENDQNTLYAPSTEYAATENGYVHIGNYESFRIFTDLDENNFGEQNIFSFENELLYSTENSAHIFYPYFFILVNYYHTFEVVTVSPWEFDGIGALTNVNKQYIEFYE